MLWSALQPRQATIYTVGRVCVLDTLHPDINYSAVGSKFNGNESTILNDMSLKTEQLSTHTQMETHIEQGQNIDQLLQMWPEKAGA